MDTFTHALSGALFARATASPKPSENQLPLRKRVLVGTVAAAFPDSDFMLRGGADLLTYLNLHRSITHSVVMLPFWGALLATLWWWFGRRQRPWRAYFGVSLLGISIHIAGDVITAYGTQIFAPLSTYKAAWPVTFVIDPWFTGILVIGLLGCWRRPQSRLPAVASLAVLVAYVGFQGTLRTQALALGYDYAHQQSLAKSQIYALPQPFSPFNWKVVVASAEEYYVGRVNFLHKEPAAPVSPEAPLWIRMYAAYPPPGTMQWVQYRHYGTPDQENLARTVWHQEALHNYRNFALLPALYAIEKGADCLCVWFVDLRFILPSLTPPFRYGGCRQKEASAWELCHLEGAHGCTTTP